MPSPNTSVLPRDSMAAAAASGGAGAARGEDEWMRAYGRLVATLPRVEALATGRAHLEAVNALQHEFWEARDALIQHRLLQADESRRRWQAAYIDLHSYGSGNERKSSELQESDSEDLTTFVHVSAAENTEFQIKLKEDDPGTEHNQNVADHEHITEGLKAELRKLKQGYEALCSEKDKEISALVQKNDLLWDQFRTLERDYANLLSNMKKEATRAIEARQDPQQNVEQLQAASERKDDEIKRLRARAKADEPKRKLVPGGKLQKVNCMPKEIDGEVETCKDQQPETSEKHKKDICEVHRKGCSEDPDLRAETKICSSMQMLAEVGQPETSQKTPNTSDELMAPNVMNRSTTSSNLGSSLVPGFHPKKKNSLKHHRNVEPPCPIDNEHSLGVEGRLNSLQDQDGGINSQTEWKCFIIC